MVTVAAAAAGGDLQCHIQRRYITRLVEQLWAATRHASLTAIISHTDLRNVSLYLFRKDSPSSSLTCQHHCWPAPTSGLRGFRGPSLFLFLISLPTIFLETWDRLWWGRPPGAALSLCSASAAAAQDISNARRQSVRSVIGCPEPQPLPSA